MNLQGLVNKMHERIGALCAELERVKRERDDLRREVEELRRAEAMRWPGGIGR